MGENIRRHALKYDEVSSLSWVHCAVLSRSGCAKTRECAPTFSNDESQRWRQREISKYESLSLCRSTKKGFCAGDVVSALDESLS